jgi:hypothetical protein
LETGISETDLRTSPPRSHLRLRKASYHTGVWLDRMHLPVVLGVMVLGPLWLPHWLYAVTMALILGSQALILGCPLMLAAHWLRTRYQDEPPYSAGSFTYWLYRKHGRWVGIPVTVVTFGVGALVLWTMWPR